MRQTMIGSDAYYAGSSVLTALRMGHGKEGLYAALENVGFKNIIMTPAKSGDTGRMFVWVLASEVDAYLAKHKAERETVAAPAVEASAPAAPVDLSQLLRGLEAIHVELIRLVDLQTQQLNQNAAWHKEAREFDAMIAAKAQRKELLPVPDAREAFLGDVSRPAPSNGQQAGLLAEAETEAAQG